MGKVAIISLLSPDIVAKDMVLKLFRVEQRSHKVSHDISCCGLWILQIPSSNGGTVWGNAQTIQVWWSTLFYGLQTLSEGPNTWSLPFILSYYSGWHEESRELGHNSKETWLKCSCCSLDVFAKQQKQLIVQNYRSLKPWRFLTLLIDFERWIGCLEWFLHNDKSQSVLDDKDLKLVLFKAMPTAWHQDFELQGYSMSKWWRNSWARTRTTKWWQPW